MLFPAVMHLKATYRIDDCLLGFSTVRPPFSLPVPHSQKGVVTCSPHIRRREVCSLPFRVEHLCNLFGVPQENCFSSPHILIYSIIYLHQYDLIDIYFVLWVIIQYYFTLLLKLFQFWLLGALSSVSCVSSFLPTSSTWLLFVSLLFVSFTC